MNLCGQNVKHKSTMQKEKKNGKDRNMDSTEKLLQTKDVQQLLYRGIQKV